MYQVVSITTMPEPLSEGFIIISCRCLRLPMACRSVALRLSLVGFGLSLLRSSLTASKKVLRALSL